MSKPPLSTQQLELGSDLAPRYDANGLVSAVVCDVDTKEVLVLAHMNDEALKLTLETGFVHFWSRSRRAVWKKGETSGNFLIVKAVFIDCDQDALVIHAEPKGPTCHTGVKSCFYRRIDPETHKLERLA